MNSRERVMTALQGGIPDKVPIMELHIDPPVIENLMPGAHILDFYESMDVDGICIWYELPYTEVEPDIKRDCFGVLNSFKAMEGTFPMPVEPLIKADMDPMNFLDHFQMPDPGNPVFLSKLKTVIDRFKGKKAVFFGMHTSMWFPMCIRGFDNFLMDTYDNPLFLHRLTEMYTDFFIELEKQAIDLGVDAIVDGEDYAGSNGLILSRDQIDEFLLPGLRRAIKVADEAGVPFIKHCDGRIHSILDMLVDTGISCLNPLEPAAGMDIGEVKKKIGDQVSLWGNIDCAELLTFGTPEQVREATIACIRQAAPGGGFILGSSNSLVKTVPPENYMALIKAGREFGNYPISLQD